MAAAAAVEAAAVATATTAVSLVSNSAESHFPLPYIGLIFFPINLP